MTDSEDNNFMQKQNEIQCESENAENLIENTERVLTPTELLAEFLSCIMMKDYEKALNYCNQILVFEPENTTAQEFYPLILQKLEMTFEDSTSESSDTDSTTSSGSFENIAFKKDFRKSSQETSNNYFGLQDNNVLDAFNDFIALNPSKPKTEIPHKIKETVGSNTRLSRSLQNPDDSKKVLKWKKPHHEGQVKVLSSKQMKKKIATKCDGSIKNKKAVITKTKHEKQKVQATANISQRTSSKILLQPTKTITFPKELPQI